MSEIRYHKRHEAYIDAVADALRKGGFEVLDWYADPNDPRDGAIRITPCGRWDDYADVFIGWQEERRWTAVPYRHGRDGLQAAMVANLTWSGAPIATVASPSTVAEAVAELLDVPWAGLPDGHPDVDFPDHVQEDEENPELEAALLRYAEVPA